MSVAAVTLRNLSHRPWPGRPSSRISSTGGSASGEFLVLLGPVRLRQVDAPNGIAGLFDVSDGPSRSAAKTSRARTRADRKIGMVFQSYALYPTMTVAGNLSFGLARARSRAR